MLVTIRLKYDYWTLEPKLSGVLFFVYIEKCENLCQEKKPKKYVLNFAFAPKVLVQFLFWTKFDKPIAFSNLLVHLEVIIIFELAIISCYGTSLLYECF